MQDQSLMEEYKGFLVDGSALSVHPNSPGWFSFGCVFSAKTRSPFVQLQRIQGPSFDSKEDAIKHGLELAKRWVDENGSRVT